MALDAPIPDEIGVIVLPDTVLFPSTILPLYIFEPRYREMFELALEGSRVVAVGTPCGEGDEVRPLGGAGLIRVCRRNPDGTSHLVLQGVGRVRFAAWVQTEPYRVARVEPLRSRRAEGASPVRLAEMVRNIVEAFAREGLSPPEALEGALANLEDADLLCDAVGALLVHDAGVRWELFEELDVPARLRKLMAALDAQRDGD